MTDEGPGNDISYIREALGEMPGPMPRVFDIYLQKIVPYNEMPSRSLYDGNAGRGYTEEEARVRVFQLNAMKVGNLAFTMRMRGMPKPDESPVQEEFTGKDENGEFLF